MAQRNTTERQDLTGAYRDLETLVYAASGFRDVFDFVWSNVGMDRIEPPQLADHERQIMLFAWAELCGSLQRLETTYLAAFDQKPEGVSAEARS